MKHTLPSRLLLLVLASLMFLLTACEGTVIRTAPDPFAQDNIGWIRGRVCDPSGASWLTDALVYTNLVDEYGHIYAYRYTYTDRDGWFVLEGIPQTPNLPVFATKGNEIIAEWEVDVFAGAVTEIPEPTCVDPLSLDVAVVTGDYDDVGTLLSSLGFADYTLVNGIQNSETQDFLSDTDLLGSYDMLFFNGGFTEEGVISDDVLINNVRNYVEAGGTIIVSDWAYDLVETMFPDKMTFVGDDTIVDDAQRGRPGLIDCRIVDPNMANSIGTDEIQVEFDLPLFPPVLFADPSVSIHMTGNVEYLDPNPIDGVDVAQANGSPVLVSFAHGAGKVVFLSFRIESNDTENALRIHRYLVFSL